MCCDWQPPSNCSVSDVGAVQQYRRAFLCTSFFKMSVMILKRQFLELIPKNKTPNIRIMSLKIGVHQFFAVLDARVKAQRRTCISNSPLGSRFAARNSLANRNFPLGTQEQTQTQLSLQDQPARAGSTGEKFCTEAVGATCWGGL